MKTKNILTASLLAIAFASPFVCASTAAPGSNNVQYLSGTGADDAVLWDFYCSDGRRSGEWTKIRVPACWEQEGFGTYFYGVWTREWAGGHTNPPAEQGKYRTTFTVPAAWKGTAVRIVFGGVFTDTEVRVNGKSAGPVHQGGFYQFEYDISALLNQGGAQNTLEVTVSKESANASINKAERRGDFWMFGGIFRPVWLESRPVQHIDRVAIDARADGSFFAEVHLGGPASPGATIVTQIVDAQNRPVGGAIKTSVAAGETTAVVREKFASPKLWSAETPNLHTAHFTYLKREYTQRFGFRTVEVRPGDGIYLNGQKIILKGINRHSFRPETGRTLTRQQCYDDARLIQEMNMNAVRMSHYPPDPAFLEACDELGLYVINELTGWQAAYDTPTGARLVGELIRRDVNHPSVLLWANGNEGGWNTDNDGEFAKWDPQRRNVIHPWALHDNINTKHYIKYNDLLKLCAGKDIFMPTEFLHGLYDGGIGASFSDYWKIMNASSVCAGGFFWVFADEGLARTDDFGRIDNCGNLAPDGIVGAHHEREGSFYAVKEIWSPVTLAKAPDANGTLPREWDGVVELRNNYAFTNLRQCFFEWSISKIQAAGAAVPGKWQKLVSPDIAPGASGTLALGATGAFSPDSIVYLRAVDANGRELWTWSWFTPPASQDAGLKTQNARPGASDAPMLLPEGPRIFVKRGPLSLSFDKYTGLLNNSAIEGRALPFSAGPSLAAFVRDNRRFTNLLPPPNDLKVGSGVYRAKVESRVESDGAVVIEAIYPEPPTAPVSGQAARANGFRKITWTIPPGDAGVRLDYEYFFEGKVDLLGVSFEVPERSVLAKRWFGRGPYRIYRNRMEGGVLGVYEQNYNDPLPGQTYTTEPEFKGYFRDWRWLELTTTGGRITLENNGAPGAGTPPFIGLWRPRDGVPLMLDIPDTSLTLLDVIPAQANKFENGDNSGPQTASVPVAGTRKGSVTMTFAK